MGPRSWRGGTLACLGIAVRLAAAPDPAAPAPLAEPAWLREAQAGSAPGTDPTTGIWALLDDLDRLKRARRLSRAPISLKPFTGFLSTALVATDRGPGGAGLETPPRTRYTAANPDSRFFTLPQASLALDWDESRWVYFHMQYDFGTDVLGGGGGTGFNEVYVVVEDPVDPWGVKLGAFAVPFFSWEVNGVFGAGNYSITLSALNTFFDRFRVLGAEVQYLPTDRPRSPTGRLGLFVGTDFALPGPGVPGTPLPGVHLGFMNDLFNTLGVSGSAILDSRPGWYLDLESSNDAIMRDGWRLGYFDFGGDPGATGPGRAPTEDVAGAQLGAWKLVGKLRLQTQWLDGRARGAVAGSGSRTDFQAWYLLGLWSFTERLSAVARVEGWENELDGAAGSFGSRGHALTVGLNRQVGPGSMIQLEFVAPGERFTGLAAGTSSRDGPDDLAQLRYRVWF